MQNVMGTQRRVHDPNYLLREGVPEELTPGWNVKRRVGMSQGVK